MRVIAGTLSGRVFASPGTFKTHPMSDRMRGALFNILGDIEGLTILDAFAGSGALGFEAVSRGAAKVVAIEQDRQAQKIIADNIRSLGVVQRIQLVKAAAESWARTYEGPQFDILLADPPYNDLQANVIEKLVQRIVGEGLIVLSWPAAEPAPNLPDCILLDQRSYANGQLIFYRKRPEL